MAGSDGGVFVCGTAKGLPSDEGRAGSAGFVGKAAFSAAALSGAGDTGLAMGTCSSVSSSSPDIGLLARGELRAGRVEGLPSPILGAIGVTGTGAATGAAAGEADGGGGDGCFAGDPGGVVLASLTISLPLSAAAGVLGGDGAVSCILGVVSLSVLGSSDGNSGLGVCSGDSGCSSPSSSCSSSSGSDSSEKD